MGSRVITKGSAVVKTTLTRACWDPDKTKLSKDKGHAPQLPTHKNTAVDLQHYNTTQIDEGWKAHLL